MIRLLSPGTSCRIASMWSRRSRIVQHPDSKAVDIALDGMAVMKNAASDAPPRSIAAASAKLLTPTD